VQVNQNSPWLFFMLTFFWSWFFWIPVIIHGNDILSFPTVMLLAAGGLSPAVSAIVLVSISKQSSKRREYWKRIIDFKRIKAHWYAVIFLLPILYSVLAFVTHGLLTANTLSPEISKDFGNPLMVMSLILITLFFGPIPEELGWRGYALDLLQNRQNALVSSLVLGIFWALWHIPLFFMEGTYQSELGLGSLRFWIFLFSLLPTSILFTWIYNNNTNSTLSAILFHFMINFTGQLFLISTEAKIWEFVYIIIISTVVVMISGTKTLTRH
jgi:membrane protease YdiL (CAAX protease family)